MTRWIKTMMRETKIDRETDDESEKERGPTSLPPGSRFICTSWPWGSRTSSVKVRSSEGRGHLGRSANALHEAQCFFRAWTTHTHTQNHITGSLSGLTSLFLPLNLFIFLMFFCDW